MKRTAVAVACLLAAAGLVSACQPTASEGQSAGKSDGKSEGQEQAQTMHASSLRESPELSREVRKVGDIEQAVVLLDEHHNAYVALTSNVDFRRRYVKAPTEATDGSRVKVASELPLPVQEHVTKAIRTADPLVETVHMTDAAEHYKLMSRKTRGGVRVLGATDETERILEIWQER